MCDNVIERYSDGVGQVHFLGGMLRLDLVSFKPGEKTDGDDKAANAKPVVVERVVMSPNAFLATFDSFVNMIEKLKQAGVIAEQPAEDKAPAAPTPVDAKPEKKPTKKATK